MKLKSFFVCCFFLACGAPEEEINTAVLSEKEFVSILKEVHLAEADFELYKTKGLETAKQQLVKAYQNIYSTHQISEEEFNNTLSYYSENPEALEKIYSDVLELLTKERATLNP